jgi:hypothetical protein
VDVTKAAPELLAISTAAKNNERGLIWEQLKQVAEVTGNIQKIKYQKLSELITAGGDMTCGCKKKVVVNGVKVISCSNNCKCKRNNTLCNSGCHSTDTCSCSNKHKEGTNNNN